MVSLNTVMHLKLRSYDNTCTVEIIIVILSIRQWWDITSTFEEEAVVYS